MTSRILYVPRETRGKRRLFSRIMKIAVGAGLVCTFLAGAIVVLRLPSVQISAIAVSGLETVDEPVLRAHIASRLAEKIWLFLPRSSFFLADTASLGADLRAAFPAIAEIRIEKIFPDGLAVTIAERSFWGIICNTLQQEEVPPQCVAIDKTGFGYESAPRPQGNLILTVKTDRALLAAGEQQIEPLLMERLQTLRDGVSAATGQEVSNFELRMSTPGDIRLKTADGFMIFFRRDDDFTNAFRVLKKVLDAEIRDRRAALDYIDVRFENKVFYKMR